MKKLKEEYALCSLCLIRRLHINAKEALNDLFINAVDNYAKKVSVESIAEVLNYVICDYYNDKLTVDLKNRLIKLVKSKRFTPDHFYRGFYDDEYNPRNERAELIEAFKHDSDLKTDLCDFYRVKQACKFLKLSGDISTLLKDIKRVKQDVRDYETRFGPDVKFMVSIDTLSKFKRDDKSNFEYHLLAAFIGIKSLIGLDSYCCTTKTIILMRMVGAKSKNALDECLKNPILKHIYDNYSKRYQFEKLIKELQLNNFISSKQGVKVGLKSRFYISCKLSSRQLSQCIIDKQLIKQKKMDDIIDDERKEKKRIIMEVKRRSI